MEIANAGVAPAAVLLLARPSSLAEGAVLALAIVPMSLLLLIGGLYWRATLLRLEGRPRALGHVLGLADRAELPSAALIAAAFITTVVLAWTIGWTGPVVAAAGCVLLAALEFVNYYQIQLQHFDNSLDWRRLLAGRGFRRAHMARDLAAYRREKD